MNFHPTFEEYWSCDAEDVAFGARYDSFSVAWTGLSEANPEYEHGDMEKAVRWALYAAASTTVPTTTVLVLPDWCNNSSTTPYLKVARAHPYLCRCLARIPKAAFAFAAPDKWRGGPNTSVTPNGTSCCGWLLMRAASDSYTPTFEAGTWAKRSGSLCEVTAGSGT